jgi:c-di-GMP-binding flagellar brake protein YcgR
MFRLHSRSKPSVPNGQPVTEAASPGEVQTQAAEAADAIGADERRGDPRRDVPLGPVVRAEFTLLGRWRSLHVDDVSLGGLGLRGNIEEGRGLFLGQKIAQARVRVGEEVVLVADLEVRIRRSFRSFLAGEQVHIGCRFLGLDPRAQEQLQHLLVQLAGMRTR